MTHPMADNMTDRDDSNPSHMLASCFCYHCYPSPRSNHDAPRLPQEAPPDSSPLCSNNPPHWYLLLRLARLLQCRLPLPLCPLYPDAQGRGARRRSLHLVGMARCRAQLGILPQRSMDCCRCGSGFRGRDSLLLDRLHVPNGRYCL